MPHTTKINDTTFHVNADLSVEIVSYVDLVKVPFDDLKQFVTQSIAKKAFNEGAMSQQNCANCKLDCCDKQQKYYISLGEYEKYCKHWEAKSNNDNVCKKCGRDFVPRKTLELKITEEILNLFAYRTVATRSQIEELYVIIGPNWHKMTEACEMLSRGVNFDEVFSRANFGYF